MSEKDVSAIDYLEDAERFADILNVYYFQGELKVLPENIHERKRNNSMPSKARKQRKSIVVNRDVVQKVDIQMNTTIIALEEQSDIHYAMPVRVMSGDSSMYHEQWRKKAKYHLKKGDLQGSEFLSGFSKKDKLIPVSTIILYFGLKPWDGPRCMKDMLDLDGLPETMKKFIADYPIHILEVRNFPDYEAFRTDLRLVFGFFAARSG